YPLKHEERVYFFFDELQYVNRWAQFVNRIQTTQLCEVYITGSSAKLLSKEIATELGGRTFTWEMFPFSFKEFLRATGNPQAITDIASRDAVIGAFDAYVEKGGILLPFLRFLRVICNRSSRCEGVGTARCQLSENPCD
ncbi:MAG: AAA family ATPase, partial [Sphaerochaetaceae bacterium]|nr:AAA family ATPase [Sphaerochaetaceae bacterium]